MPFPIHSGQTIVVTGASKGIGAEVASRLGRLGARVVMLARNIDALKKVALEIQLSNSGGSALPFRIDLRKLQQMIETVNRIIEEVGVPDVLINNAGAGEWTTLLETKPEDIIQNIEVPGISTMIITKLFLDKMLKKATPQSPVHIINITSPAGLGMYVPGTSGGYSVARFMVTNFTELLRIDLKPYQDSVKISLVAPGKVSTGYFKTNGNKQQEDRVPMQKWIAEITPHEVARQISQIIANRKSVNAVFPFGIKALVTAFKLSPTLMQFFLTHVFGWQPTKDGVTSSSNTFKKISAIAAVVAVSLLACYTLKMKLKKAA